MIRSSRWPVLGLVLAAAALLAGCAERPVPKLTLYERLGGQEAIVAVVDKFVENVAADARVNGFFAKTDPVPFKQHLVDQICEAAGGPCTYTGRAMKPVHAGRGIKDEHWDAVVEDLIAALDHFKVPEQEKSDLLGLLAPMKPDIVEG